MSEVSDEELDAIRKRRAPRRDDRVGVEAELKDVGDQALMRGLDTAFPTMRPELFLSYCGPRSVPATKRLTDVPLPLCPDGTVEDVKQTLSTLLGVHTAVAAAVPVSMNNRLYPHELQHIQGCVRARQNEFGTARVLAREALADLGIVPTALMPNSDRSPRWPSGIVGSISHTNGLCVVIAASNERMWGLGVDVERDDPLDFELVPLICTTEEREWLAQQPQAERSSMAKLIFSAKEAFYKFQYPTSRKLLDFLDVELAFDLPAKQFLTKSVRSPETLPKFALSMRGHFHYIPGLILTVAKLSREEF
jgi:4'-phosphopantetheinyl transferase EntD